MNGFTIRWTPILLIIATLVMWGCATTTKVEKNSAISYDPRAAHAEADRNGDGYVDPEEFNQRIVEIFFHGDSDKDGYMSFDEIEQAVIFSEDWNQVDTDHDGRISLYEFIRLRFADYNQVDTDRDGLLSVDEVVNAFEVRQ